jgi:hypothetical protein
MSRLISVHVVRKWRNRNPVSPCVIELAKHSYISSENIVIRCSHTQNKKCVYFLQSVSWFTTLKMFSVNITIFFVKLTKNSKNQRINLFWVYIWERHQTCKSFRLEAKLISESFNLIKTEKVTVIAGVCWGINNDCENIHIYLKKKKKKFHHGRKNPLEKLILFCAKISSFAGFGMFLCSTFRSIN